MTFCSTGQCPTNSATLARATEGEFKGRRASGHHQPSGHRRQKGKRTKVTVAEKLYISALIRIMFTVPGRQTRSNRD